MKKKQKILISIIIIIFILVVLWFLNKPVYTVNDLNPDDFTVIVESNDFKSAYIWVMSSNGNAHFNYGDVYDTCYKISKNEVESLRKIIMSPDFWKTKKIYIGKFHILFMEAYLDLKIISNNKTIKSIKFIWKYNMPSIIRELLDRMKKINYKYCYNEKGGIK